MTTLKFKISSDIVRRANNNLVNRGVDNNSSSYTGTVTTRFYINGIERTQEISKEKINKAFAKSLDTYAKKL